MGFCFVNHIALGALYARQNFGLDRIAVIDFDVHHGNGTEDILAHEEGMLMVSSFQQGIYPGSGTRPKGPNMVNVPLPAGSGTREIRTMLDEIWIPILQAFRPQLMLVSAGFDAHRDDPLAGLAWTEVGGELLTIEVASMPGKGAVQRTGSIGDVMKESVEAARTVVRSRARRLGIKDDVFEKTDLHVHFPEGATPKDGPSAGIAITTAIVSALTGIPVRCDVAMTGEITLRGEVLAIGGLKEKLLAAVRGGITRALIPHENVKDLVEIPDTIKGRIEIIPVKWIDEVLDNALANAPVPLLESTETAETAAPTATSVVAPSVPPVTH